MTLDERIHKAEEDAKIPEFDILGAFEYVEDCRQLADWLKELKKLKELIRWVPISERTPEENGWYECTVVSNDLPRTMELFYKNGKWLDNRRIDMFNLYDIYGYGNTNEKHKLSYQEISEFEWTENVIAWQPLSNPYKPQESEVKE